jgi:cytoskeletal protein RodZ
MLDQGVTVGRFLQKERETKNISLQTVAKETRIKMDFLQAIEEDAFRLLPAEAYALGFIRNYANFMRLNPDEVIALYRAQKNSSEDPDQGEKAKSSAFVGSLKFVKDHLFDFLATMMGASPAFPVSKSVLPPKH